MAEDRGPKSNSDRQRVELTEELPLGVRLLRTLQGHLNLVTSVSFSADGQWLASGSDDQTVRLWDAASGKELRQFTGHVNSVRSVSLSPDGQWLASGSADHTVRLWNTASGKEVRRFTGDVESVGSVSYSPDGRWLASGGVDGAWLWNAASGQELQRFTEARRGCVKSVSFSPDGRWLAGGSDDRTVRLWDVPSGMELWEFHGHHSYVTSVTFSPDGRWLASGSADQTVRLWDAASGKLLRTLEGHTDWIDCVAFSPKGELLASKSADGTLRLWRCDTWETTAAVQQPCREGRRVRALAFHPTLPWLATAGPVSDTPEHELPRLIHLWELDLHVLLGRRAGVAPPPQVVHHTTAKIVLVGDSGVGKTGLGWRLAHGEFKEHSSTHGQQFWVMQQLSTRRRDGTECEAILWDLAGQPDYRLIHALFLDDADLALVLFDPTDTRDPLHGVEYWLRQLRVGQASRLSEQPAMTVHRQDACPTLLVAARADRGTPTLTDAEIQTFCQQRGLRGYVRTSAKAGEGLEDLIQRMKGLIPWEDKPAITTEITFKRVKDFVLDLKAHAEGKPVVVSWPELREQLAQTDAAWQFTDAEMKTAVGHLENYGYVRRLRTSKGEERVLLKPELLNNLAASFILEARRNPKGLGALEEKRLQEGGYRFPELEGLSRAEQDILIDAAALLFLERHVCFREQTLDGLAYLVFPELINLKIPPLEETEALVEGVAYTVSGAVENVYASLVVLLGYTQTFTRTAQWKAQARYEVSGGAVCGFRQEAEREGELDFVLYFCANVGSPERMLFQGLFECFLARRNLTVLRFEPVLCTNAECGHPLDRSVVRQRVKEGKTFACCNECGEKLTLPKMAEPIQLTRAQQAEVEAQRRVADQRTRFEQAIYRVQAYVAEQKTKVPECFISYAWGVPEHERWVEKRLATDLQKAGIGVVLDRWENDRAGRSVSRFVSRIADCGMVIPVGTPLYFQKFQNKVSSTGSVVASEVDLISQRLMGTEADKETVMPILLAGEKKTSLPPLMWDRVHRDFGNEGAYFTMAFDLILDLYDISHQDSAIADLRDSLYEPRMR